VACGATHTLVLRNNKLWVLGSGLDLKPRASNLAVVKKKLAGVSKPSTFLEPNGCFSPRKLDVILSDSAEFSCQTGPFYRENYSQEVKELTVEEAVVQLDDDAQISDLSEQVIVTHTVLCISFSGDFQLEAGDEVAFKGPYAPPGLALEDRSQGPFFRVLGLRGKDGKTFHLSATISDRNFDPKKMEQKYQDCLLKDGRTLRETATDLNSELSPLTQVGKSNVQDRKATWHAHLAPYIEKAKGREGGHIWIEAPDAIMMPDPKTKKLSAKLMVAWMNRNITTSNAENVLICKAQLLPPLKEVASGAFHASVVRCVS
jgi:hypothetical protein